MGKSDYVTLLIVFSHIFMLIKSLLE